MYNKYVEIDKTLTAHIHQHDHSMVEEFRALIRKIFFRNLEDSDRKKIFASQLTTHPNHLNAVVKGKLKTAIAFIHEQLVQSKITTQSNRIKHKGNCIQTGV
jgi:hypothetical protein